MWKSLSLVCLNFSQDMGSTHPLPHKIGVFSELFSPLGMGRLVPTAIERAQVAPGLLLGVLDSGQFCVPCVRMDSAGLFERTTFCRLSNFSFSWHPRQSSLSTHPQHIGRQDFFNEIAGNLPSRLGPVN